MGMGAGTGAVGAGTGIGTVGAGTGIGAVGPGTGTGALGAGTGGKGVKALNAAEAFTSPDPVPKSNPTSKPTVDGSSISIAVLDSVE
jgi:hypothetical protein